MKRAAYILSFVLATAAIVTVVVRLDSLPEPPQPRAFVAAEGGTCLAKLYPGAYAADVVVRDVAASIRLIDESYPRRLAGETPLEVLDHDTVSGTRWYKVRAGDRECWLRYDAVRFDYGTPPRD